MSDRLKRFRATVRHEGENICDLPWLEEFWAVRHEEAAARIEELEAKLAKAVEALDKLARLGNGEKPGNSDGNMIARAALAEINGGQP